MYDATCNSSNIHSVHLLRFNGIVSKNIIVKW